MNQGRSGRSYKALAWLIILGGVSTYMSIYYLNSKHLELNTKEIEENILSRQTISNAISEQINNNIFPEETLLTSNEKDEKFKLEYTIRSNLQNYAEGLLKRYKPDYAAVVMMDATTGEILTMSSFEKANSESENLALKASFPAASIFKVITAATAVDKAGISPNHRIAFNGGNYTLYRKNVLSDKVNRWTRYITLKDAFAKSINTAFGRLSLESLEPEDLSEYANKFYFNQEIPSDFKIEKSMALIPKEKGYPLTAVASGYNRFNTLSPVHGAMIASAIVNNGQMPMPYIVKNIQNENNEQIYTAESMHQDQVISPKSAEKLKQMMEQTVLTGTSRKTFKKIVRDRNFREIEMGGKTGHFSGTDPVGKNDWFVGYASDGEDKVALAVITVSKKYWTVKSSALGEMMFRKYFKDKQSEQSLKKNSNKASFAIN